MTDRANDADSREEPALDPADAAVAPHQLWVAVLFTVVAALVAVDVITDLGAGARTSHVVVEVLAFAAAAAAAVALLREWARTRRIARALRADVASAREDAARWRSEAQAHVAGLSALIDRQFDAWSLSPAERAVALLLLKGLSHKDVASVRGTSERTAREQALAIYRKAGLAGRAELAAFFLEDLLAPAAERR
jgi:DNA-binding CsgD family transcriptional regulator